LEGRVEEEALEEVIEVHDLRIGLLALDGAEVGPIGGRVQADAGIEEAEEPFVVEAANFDETVDLGEVRVDFPVPEGLDLAQQDLEFLRGEPYFAVGIEGCADALAKPLVGKGDELLLLVARETALDEVVEVALGNPGIRIRHSGPGDLGEGSETRGEGVDRLGEALQDEVLLGAIIGGMKLREARVDFLEIGAPLRFLWIAGKQSCEEQL